MGLCQYVYLCFHALFLPSSHTFWHAIPTSFYIFNVFLSLVLQGSVLSVAWYSMSTFDCLHGQLAHFLEWCECSFKLLNFGGCGLTRQFLEILHRVNLEHHGTTQIEEVNLSYNHHGLMTKLSLLPIMIEHTRVLKLHSPQYPEGVSPDQVELHCLLNMRHLTTLEISVKDCSKMEYFLSLATFAKALRKATKLYTKTAMLQGEH